MLITALLFNIVGCTAKVDKIASFTYKNEAIIVEKREIDDLGIIVVGIASSGGSCKYFKLASSLTTTFGSLRVKAFSDGEGIWFDVFSDQVTSSAYWNIKTKSLYTKHGVTSQGSFKPDITLTDYESAPMPERAANISTVFEKSVTE